MLPNTRWMVVVTTSPTSLCLQPIKTHTHAVLSKGRAGSGTRLQGAAHHPCRVHGTDHAEACLGRHAARGCMRCSAGSMHIAHSMHITHSMHIAHSMQTQAQRDATLTWVPLRPRALRPLTSGSQPPPHPPPPVRLQRSGHRQPTNEESSVRTDCQFRFHLWMEVQHEPSTWGASASTARGSRPGGKPWHSKRSQKHMQRAHLQLAQARHLLVVHNLAGEGLAALLPRHRWRRAGRGARPRHVDCAAHLKHRRP